MVLLYFIDLFLIEFQCYCAIISMFSNKLSSLMQFDVYSL